MSSELGQQLVLTGDANLVQINVVAQYDVVQVEEYVLAHKTIDKTVTKIVQRNMVEILGQSSVDQEHFLYRNVLEDNIRKACDGEIQTQNWVSNSPHWAWKKLSAPNAVIDAFNEISSARGEKGS